MQQLRKVSMCIKLPVLGWTHATTLAFYNQFTKSVRRWWSRLEESRLDFTIRVWRWPVESP